MRVAVIANRSEPWLGHFEHHSAELGFTLFRFFREDFISASTLDNFDLVVHLGSSWSIPGSGSRNLLREIQVEQNIVRSSLMSGTPTIGVCFGAQIIASSLGGTVHRNHKLEIGWCNVNNQSGCHVLDGPWFQWHYDGIIAPPGSDVGASNDFGVQVISGRRYLGLQFHPEMDRSLLYSWLENGGLEELEVQNVCIETLIKQSEVHLAGSEERFRELLNWFLNSVST